MYIYSVGYFGWEGSPYTMLSSPVEYKPDEFSELIANISAKTMKEKESFTFSIGYVEIINELVEKYGFKKVVPIAAFSVDEFTNAASEKTDFKSDANLLIDALNK